jgi:thiol-disulfide isomerase/thioredoxin
MEKLKTFLLDVSTLLIISMNSATAQKTFTVDFVYRESKELSDSFYFQILKPPENITQIQSDKRFYTIKDYKFFRNDSGLDESICSYLVSDTSCSLFFDGFGFESFVIPGDTIKVYIEKKPKIEGHYWVNKDKDFKSVWFHNYLFQGKNRYIYSIFDSLAYQTNMIQYGYVNLQKAGMRLDTLFKMVTEIYNMRINYLNHYCLLHRIPNTIMQLAFAEIRSAYIINLTQPMANVVTFYPEKDYTKEYLDSLSSFNNLHNEQLCFRSLLYGDAVYQYISLFRVRFKSNDSSDESEFQNKYQTFRKLEEGYNKMKEHLLSLCLLSSLKSDYSSFPSFLMEFEDEYPNSESSLYLDSLYLMRKRKPVATFEQALNNSVVINEKGDKFILKNVLHNKPVLIDCWASWCAPCIYQIPFSKDIEKKYGDKIDIIYLSLDKNRDAWLSKNSQFFLHGQSYLLDENFKSDFAHHFDIETIPRYLLFDGKGRLITSNALRPSRQEALNTVIKNAISKNNQ